MTLEEQAELLAENIRGWEHSAIRRVGRRIAQYDKMTLADVKTINNITMVNQDMQAITKELADVSGKNIAEVEQMYADLLTEQHLQNKPLYDFRNKPFVPFAENMQLQSMARAYAKSTAGTMVNLSKTKALCVVDNNGIAIDLQRYYTQALDKAALQVGTGATDFYTAMRETVLELGGSGLRVNYGSGLTRRLDTAVRQSVLWGAKQASVAYNEMIGEELGCDGYEIDWHSNPRPSHEFMQGKQYVVGDSRTINGEKFESFEKSGAEDALNDYGCLHFKTPIICGISEPRYDGEELIRLNEENAKMHEINGREYTGYEVTQLQRRIETQVRYCKDEINALQGLGNSNQQIQELNARKKVLTDKYSEIESLTGITGNKKRMSVPKKSKN